MGVVRRAIGALALLLIASGASAQIGVPVRVLAQQTRQGTFTTASVVLPALTAVEVACVIDAADQTNETKQFTVNVFASPDGATGWRSIQRYQWQGGTVPDPPTTPGGPPPGTVHPRPCIVTFGPLAPYAGWRVRADIDIPSSLRLGVDLTPK